MNWFSGLVVYVVLWWLVFFMALPFGVKAPHEIGEETQPGHASGAPARHGLALKAILATAIAAVLWIGAYFLIVSNLISFRPK